MYTAYIVQHEMLISIIICARTEFFYGLYIQYTITVDQYRHLYLCGGLVFLCKHVTNSVS